MYSVLLDVSNEHFVFIIFDETRVCYKDIRRNLMRKSEIMAEAFKLGLAKLKIEFSQIKKFYVTLGPGSFTGSRTGLIFFKTLVQFSNADLFLTDTMSFITKKSYSGDVFFDARSDLFYKGEFSDGKLLNEISLVPKNSLTKVTLYPIDEIEKNVFDFLSSFKKVNDVLNVQPIYIKMPSIFPSKGYY